MKAEPHSTTQRAVSSAEPPVRSSSTPVILGWICVAGALYLVRDILLPFVVAGTISFLLSPVIDWFAIRLRLSRTLVAVAVLMLLLIGIAPGFIFGIPPLWHQIMHLTGDLEGTVTQLLHQFMGSHTLTVGGKTLDASQLAHDLVNYAGHWLSESGKLPNLLMIGFGGVVMFFLSLVVLAYCLIDGPKLADGLLWIAPPRQRAFVMEVWSRLAPLLRRYFLGVALVVVYATVAAYLGLGLILRLHGAIFLALMTGLLEMLPVVGPAASAAIAGIAALEQTKSASSIIGYIAYAMALRVSIDQFFGPLVLGRAARVRPVLVIFGFLAGGLLLGVSGVILAVPIVLSTRVILETRYDKPRQPVGPLAGDSEHRDADSPA